MSLIVNGSKYGIYNQNSIASIEYRKHKVFQQLSDYIEFYDSLSFAVIGWFKFGIEGGGILIESQIYASMQGTLESINAVLHNGRINDAYALLRKFHDSAIINVYADLYLEETFNTKNLIVGTSMNGLRASINYPGTRV